MSTAVATTTPAPSDGPTTLFEIRHRITVAEYHRMADAGIFGPDARVELLEGVIVEKMTNHPPHVLVTDLIQDLLQRLIPAGYFVSMGNPVTIEDRDSEPEPDAMVLRGRIRDYAGRRRTSADSALVVEVADSSYSIDRHQKWATYAAAGVPGYWIVDLNRGRLEIHEAPEGSGEQARYGCSVMLGRDDEAPLTLDSREVARFSVKDILP